MSHNLIKLFIEYSTSIIPTFLFALSISAILSETLPERFFEKIINSKQIIFILLSSVFGALIPLCTCGMIPLASKLHKKGVSWLVVISFLTSGNASSITALFLTFVLGLKITLWRFLFAIVFGIIVAYIFVLFFKPQEVLNSTLTTNYPSPHSKSILERILKEFLNLIFSFGPWVVIAIFIASVISLYLRTEDVVTLAGTKNITSPFLFALSGIPFYFCAGSDIPISKALLDKGAGLGSVLAFMTASPGVNITSFLMYQKWLGLKNTIVYLAVSFLVCGVMGLIVNLMGYRLQ